MPPRNAGRLLVVDDEEVIRSLVTTHLEAQGFTCESADNGRHALELAAAGGYDLVMTDVRMPGLDGLSLIRELQQLDPALPVIIVTALSSFDTAVRALKHGAYDYILKPFHLETLDAAVQRAMEKRRLLRENQQYQRLLEKKVEEKTANLLAAKIAVERQSRKLRRGLERMRGSMDATVTAIVDGIEGRGGETRNHCRRVRSYTLRIARRLGVAAADLRDLGWGALLHDIGTVTVPDAVLLKRGTLTEDEWELMRRHPIAGWQMLREVEALGGASLVVLHHHEMWDGTGYPYGRRGEDIPIGARCFAVADALDALTAHRPHRARMPLFSALEVIERSSGTHFDPDAVRSLLAIPKGELERVRHRHLEQLDLPPATASQVAHDDEVTRPVA